MNAKENPLDRPLVFGDKDQIEALKKAEADAEFKKLPNCLGCGGSGYRRNCVGECERCAGIGKPWEAWERFRLDYPNYVH